MFNLREIIKMTVNLILEDNGNLIKISDEQKVKLIEKVAYEHAKKYNYPYFNLNGHS